MSSTHRPDEPSSQERPGTQSTKDQGPERPENPQILDQAAQAFKALQKENREAFRNALIQGLKPLLTEKGLEAAKRKNLDQLTVLFSSLTGIDFYPERHGI